MGDDTAALTVYFEEPFWVGVFERVEGGKLSACKVTFGAEPKDAAVWELVLRQYGRLAFGPAVEAESGRKPADNPKRRQRQAKRQLQNPGIGTKSQQALQKQREERKRRREETGRQRREAEQQRRFELRQQKKKEKKRGH